MPTQNRRQATRCGVPDEFIAMIPSLIGAMQPIQFNSCFISYSSKDEEFAQRLFSRMREQSRRAGTGVVRQGRDEGRADGQRADRPGHPGQRPAARGAVGSEHAKSFGEDLAGLLCSYVIPDFSNWKEHDAFESAFARVLKDLRAESGAKG